MLHTGARLGETTSSCGHRPQSCGLWVPNLSSWMTLASQLLISRRGRSRLTGMGLLRLLILKHLLMTAEPQARTLT